MNDEGLADARAANPSSSADATRWVQYSHYSLPATVEAIFNLVTLGRNDTSATPMSDLFRGRNPLGLRFLRRFRLAGTVEGGRLANERLEGGLVNFFSFVDVDRAACVSVETRVEETGRVLQRRALGEGKLHDILVGFTSADDAVVRPNRSAHPLPLLDDVRVRFVDDLAHSAEVSPAPVPEFGDSFRDELRCRLAVARARLFHVPILEGPDMPFQGWHDVLLFRSGRLARGERPLGLSRLVRDLGSDHVAPSRWGRLSAHAAEPPTVMRPRRSVAPS